MTTTVQINDNNVIIRMVGSLDTLTSGETNTIINTQLSTLSCDPSVAEVICDASCLEYISSSGLRILLSLAKRFKNFRVIEVRPQVYEVLETTRFTEIMKIERSLRRLSIEGCSLIGIGGVGKVYRLNGDTIIKVFREGSTMEEVQKEIILSKESFVLGMPTPISFDVVKVAPLSDGDPECYGLVYELLEAHTLSTYVKSHPDELDSCARKYADLFSLLHQIEVPEGGSVPSALESVRRQVEHIRRYFPEEKIEMLLNIVNSIPAGNRLLHMDLQTKNAMMQEGELMLIDMGEVGYGHPLLDLSNAYSAMVSFVGDYENVIGLPREMGQRLWEKALDYYMEGLPADVIAERKKQIEVASCVRKFSWLSLSDSFPETVIRECQELFEEVVVRRYDYIMDVCKTFKNWKL